MTAREVMDFLPEATDTAVHLETRDTYTPDDPQYLNWQKGIVPDPENRDAWWDDWHQIVADTAARGVHFRRVRIVSEPVTDYIRFEYEVTYRNVLAGEEVRWLPRHRAYDLAHPANDCWLVDDEILVVHNFSGDGHVLGGRHVTDPATVELYRTSLPVLWNRAIPHQDYQPR